MRNNVPLLLRMLFLRCHFRRKPTYPLVLPSMFQTGRRVRCPVLAVVEFLEEPWDLQAFRRHSEKGSPCFLAKETVPAVASGSVPFPVVAAFGFPFPAFVWNPSFPAFGFPFPAFVWNPSFPAVVFPSLAFVWILLVPAVVFLSFVWILPAPILFPAVFLNRFRLPDGRTPSAYLAGLNLLMERPALQSVN